MLARRAMNEVSADMVAPRPMFEVKTLDVKNYYENLVKTRPLTEQENHLRLLSLVAGELKVEKFFSYNKEPGALVVHDFSTGMVKKMHEHPQWDVALSSQSMTNINSQIELLKKTFGPKSYGWAWFLKQLG